MAVNNDDYAIVIGIDTYPELFRLRSAHDNATEFSNWLTLCEGGGLPEENVKLFLGPEKVMFDAPFPVPIQWHIDTGLRMMGIERNERIGRRLYFYFAGHGFGPTFDNIGMLMIDARENNLESNIGLREYRDFFMDHHIFDEIVYIMDCCRDPVPKNVSEIQLKKPGFDLEPKRNEVQDYVVLAAAYGEKAYAPKSKDNGRRRGLLTAALMEGLEKAYDGFGRVTSASLADHILNRVPELVDEMKADKKLKDQKPETNSPKPEIVFKTAPADRLFKVHIIAEEGSRGSLILYDGNASQLDIRASKDATAEQPWELELLRNRRVYVVEHTTSGKQIPILPKMVTKEPHIVTLQ